MRRGVNGLIDGSNILADQLGIDPDEFLGIAPDHLRDMVERDLLTFLAGPAASWRSGVRGGGEHGRLTEFLETRDSCNCDGDMDAVYDLLDILPEQEADRVYLSACEKAENLVCRYWPSVCRLGDVIADKGHIEGDALNELIDQTLGDSPKAALSELEHRIQLGNTEVHACWCRPEPGVWRLLAECGGFPLTLSREVVYLTRAACDRLAEEGEEGWAPGWWVDTGDDVFREPPAGNDALGKFISAMVADKLAELRVDPDAPPQSRSL